VFLLSPLNGERNEVRGFKLLKTMTPHPVPLLVWRGEGEGFAWFVYSQFTSPNNLIVVEILDAAHESARTGKRIDLPKLAASSR
jgi:hypothetical protein